MEDNKTYFGYVRVSSEEQALKATSVEAQTNLILKHEPSTKIYSDEGISAKGEEGCYDPNQLMRKRLGLKELLKEVQLKTAEGCEVVVLLCDWDRLSRSNVLFAILMEFEKTYGFKWQSITQSNEHFVRNLHGNLAEEENRKKSERVKRVLDEKRSKGLWICKAPFGYKNLKKFDRATQTAVPTGKIGVVKKSAEVVVKIYELYLEFKSINKTTENIKLLYPKHKDYSGRHIKFGKTNIGNILRNTVYCGYDLNNNIGTHTPIISKEMFRDVQLIMKANRK